MNKENIQYALQRLQNNTINEIDSKSKYAVAIMEFWNLPFNHSFYVHGCVFKAMDKNLIEHLVKWEDKRT